MLSAEHQYLWAARWNIGKPILKLFPESCFKIRTNCLQFNLNMPNTTPPPHSSVWTVKANAKPAAIILGGMTPLSYKFHCLARYEKSLPLRRCITGLYIVILQKAVLTVGLTRNKTCSNGEKQLNYRARRVIVGSGKNLYITRSSDSQRTL